MQTAVQRFCILTPGESSDMITGLEFCVTMRDEYPPIPAYRDENALVGHNTGNVFYGLAYRPIPLS
jgi:hypothetical protein